MAFQVSPGVNVAEIDLTTRVPVFSVSDGGFVGKFTWGPIDTVTLVSNEDDLVNEFGKPNANNFKDFFTCSNFLSYSDKLRVGEWVMAVGSPFSENLSHTVTTGIVSALGRSNIMNSQSYEDFIQTDAAINPGNSGGPLLNSSGQIIGVNTAIRSPSGASAGIGFAIPINTLKNIVPQLIEHGKVVRPVMGVELLSDYWTKRLGARGVAIFSVIEGLPAERAGMVGVRYDKQGKIHLGDVLIDINGALVSDEDTLLEQLEKFEPGDTIQVTTTRNEKIKRYQLTLAAPNPGN